MAMARRLEAEWLDVLPASDPRAARSRRDLVRVNALMGNARIVANAVGKSGKNADYVLNTVAHLRVLGIRDHWMEEVAQKIHLYQELG